MPVSPLTRHRGLTRLGGLAALAVVAIVLAGCTADGETVATPTPTASPTDDGSESAAGGLNFEAGNELGTDITTAPAFNNGFAAEGSGWVEDADQTSAENGTFVYTSEDGLCTASLYQLQALGDFEVVEGDDKTTSDNVLKWFFRDSPAVANSIDSSATDAILPYGADWESGDPGADFRGISGQTDDDTTFAAYARGFGQPQVALISVLTCDTLEGFGAHLEDALMDSAVLTFE